MPIQKPPYSGQIVMCDYEGFVVPEMIKRRPVIVVSPKPRHHFGLCAVIPLSTTPPKVIEKHHITITLPDDLVQKSQTRLEKSCWAKCDMVNTVSLARLDLIRMGRCAAGKRLYSYFRIDAETLDAVRDALVQCLTGRH